jgi:excisionase family DNA binding protein
MPLAIDDETVLQPDQEVQATSGILRELLLSAERTQTSPVVSLSREPDKQSISTVALPPALVHMFLQTVDHLNKGQAIALMAFNPLLSTHQAAKLLGVSRPYLIKLLERGEIGYHKTGAHRRIKLEDLMAYKEKRDRQRQEALEKMTRITQESEADYMGENFSVEDLK